MSRIRELTRYIFVPTVSSQRILTTAFFIIGFSAPALYALIQGPPIPIWHDEFGYLLSADTYASGRITNPTPRASKSFEVPHVLLQPTYISKYPPMQGLFLAVGQVLFGSVAFGIWLSCGFAAASLFWMLCAWTPQRWAVIATSGFICFLGIYHYWAQSFWGGMAAAAGGALFLGGLRRLFNRPSMATALLMTAGGIVLVNSRPFEGTAMMLIPLAVLGVWCFSENRFSRSIKVTRVAIPGLILGAAAIGLMAFNNHRVTGRALEFPYSEHQSQYLAQPLFLFQSRSVPEVQLHPRLARIYEAVNRPDSERAFEVRGFPHSRILYALYAGVHRALFLPFSYLTPTFGILFFIGLIRVFRRRWLLIAVLSIAFTIACMSIASYWVQPHYAAPLVCCYFLFGVEGLRTVHRWLRTRSRIFAVGLAAFFLITLIVHYPLTVAQMPRNFVNSTNIDLNRRIGLDQPVEVALPGRTTILKSILENSAAESSARYLAIVSYDASFDIHDEMTFNRSDLDREPIVWAADLGQEPNLTLMNAFPDRKVLYVRIRGYRVEIDPQ
jgi:hypothetical protein